MIDLSPQNIEFVANPYPTYRQLQQQTPLYYRRQTDDWIFTRYCDVKFASTNQCFEYPHIPPTHEYNYNAWEQLFDGDGTIFAHLFQKCQQLQGLWLPNQGPPHHNCLKRVMMNSFLPKSINALRPKIHAMVMELIAQIENKQSIDIVTDIAIPLPEMVICHILKIPYRDFLTNFNSLIKKITDGIDLDAPSLAKKKGAITFFALVKYTYQLVRARQNNLQDDPLSQYLIAMKQQQLDANELLANMTLLLLAGIATTKTLIAKGILALLNNPSEKTKLLQQPQLINSTVEECLRYDSPNHYSVRIAREDVAIDDIVIKKGQKLRLFLAAAHRDPQVFPQPDKFDITRNPNPHLAFGSGTHFCLGAHLARLEAQIAIAELVKRFPKMTLAQPPKWETGLRLHGLKSLKVNTCTSRSSKSEL